MPVPVTRWRRISAHGRHEHPHAAPALPAAEPAVLGRRRARRPARGLGAHPAPRRRPAARARLPGGGAARRRRRLPARARGRRCRRWSSTTTRRSRWPSGLQAAAQTRGRRDGGGLGAGADQGRAGAAGPAAPPGGRAARGDRAGGLAAARRASTPRCSPPSRRPAGTPSGCGSPTPPPAEPHRAARRAASAWSPSAGAGTSSPTTSTAATGAASGSTGSPSRGAPGAVRARARCRPTTPRRSSAPGSTRRMADRAVEARGAGTGGRRPAAASASGRPSRTLGRGRCRVRMEPDDLSWPALALGTVGAEFTVVYPARAAGAAGGVERAVRPCGCGGSPVCLASAP